MEDLNLAAKPARMFGVEHVVMGEDGTIASAPRSLSQTFVPCIDLFGIRTYLRNPVVLSAFHIPAAQLPVEWDACSSILNYGGINGNMIPIYEDLLTNYTSLRIMIYSGDVDSCVPWIGTEETVMKFPFVQTEPLKDAWGSWGYIAQEAPTVTQVGGKFMQWSDETTTLVEESSR